MVSHQLLARAGFVRHMSAGLYAHLPLMVRSLKKLEALLDQELQAIGCQKLEMPLVMGSRLWEKSGRWQSAGAELIRFKDRKGADHCLAPTHEEAFTALVGKTSFLIVLLADALCCSC